MNEAHPLLRNPGAAYEAQLFKVDQFGQLFNARIGECIAVCEGYTPQAPHCCKVLQTLPKMCWVFVNEESFFCPGTEM